jgi:hypothetical protein
MTLDIQGRNVAEYQQLISALHRADWEKAGRSSLYLVRQPPFEMPPGAW